MNIAFYTSLILLLISFPFGLVLCVYGIIKGFELLVQLKKHCPEVYEKYKDSYYISPYSFSEYKAIFSKTKDASHLIDLTDELKSVQKKFLIFFVISLVLFALMMVLGFFRN
jgi:hypothetical protein